MYTLHIVLNMIVYDLRLNNTDKIDSINTCANGERKSALLRSITIQFAFYNCKFQLKPILVKLRKNTPHPSKVSNLLLFQLFLAFIEIPING